MRQRLTAGLALALTAAWAGLGTLPTTGLGAAAAQSAQDDTAQQQTTQDETDQKSPQITEMTLGAEDAPVTVIEYGSFTCPHCKRFHAEVFDRIKQNYVDTGKVRFVYREVYRYPQGLWASMLARCGGKDRFFGITDLLYQRQSEWTKGDAKAVAGKLVKIGRVAGLDGDRISACFNDADKAAALRDWSQAKTSADDITATPTFIIDGQKYSNMSYDKFARTLDNELAES